LWERTQGGNNTFFTLIEGKIPGISEQKQAKGYSGVGKLKKGCYEKKRVGGGGGVY